MPLRYIDEALHRRNRMLLWQIRNILGFQLAQSLAQSDTRFTRTNHHVDIATLSSYIRRSHVFIIEIHEHLLGHLALLGSFSGIELLARNHHNGRSRAHHGNLRGRPRKVNIAGQVLRTHHRISTAESLAHNQRNLWHGGLNTSERKLRAAVNKPDFLLLNTRDRKSTRLNSSHVAISYA